MTSAPIVAMVLAKENAIQQWRELIGPTNSGVAKETHPDRFYSSLLFLFKLSFI
jgi:nucleoside-diphosphate kinase